LPNINNNAEFDNR